MSNLIFDKNHWIDKIKSEIGLENVLYENLGEYFVDFGNVFGESSNKVSAKEYVDREVASVEEQYRSFNEQGDVLPMSNDLDSFDADAVMGNLLEISQIPIIELPAINDIEEETPEIPSKFSYFSVFIDNRDYIVAINDYGDLKIQDQIKHIKNTSYFVEQKLPETIQTGEVIISYYQFVNLIEKEVAKSRISTYEKIQQNLNTVFNGTELKWNYD